VSQVVCVAVSPLLVGTFSWSEFFFFGPLDKCFDVFPARRDRPVKGGQSSHRPLVRWLGPTRSSFRERMASSRGAPVAYLLWLLATFLKALQPPAAQPTAWTLPQLGRRQRRDLTASLNLEAKKHGSLNWDPLCHGSPPHGCFASAGAGGHSSKGKQNSTNHPATAGEDGLFVGNGWERLLTLALPQAAVGDGSDRLPGRRLPAPGSSKGTGLGHCPIHAASH